MKTITLEKAQEIVGGYVERVRALSDPTLYMLIDEEGKLKGKHVNAHGCELYRTLEHGDTIVGDIIVFKRNEGRRWA